MEQFQIVFEFLSLFVVDLQILAGLVGVQCFIDLLIEGCSFQIMFNKLIPGRLNAHAYFLTLIVSDSEVQTNENDDQTEQGEERTDNQHWLIEQHDLVEGVMNFEVLDMLKEHVAFTNDHHRSTDSVQVGVVLFIVGTLHVVSGTVEFYVTSTFRQDHFDRRLFDQLVVVDVIDQTHFQNVLISSRMSSECTGCWLERKLNLLIVEILIGGNIVTEDVMGFPSTVQRETRANLDFDLILQFLDMTGGDIADLISIVDIASRSR